MAAPIIDIHPHIASEDTVRYPISPLAGKRSEWSEERSVTLEQMIAAMDEAGVNKCAMVHSSTTYGFNCDYVADAVAAYPDRMTGVFSINVLEPDAAQKMRYWFSKGLTGMRIYSRGSTVKESWLRLDDPRIFPCYETAAELDISIASNVKDDEFSQLETVLQRFPKVKFILDHSGGVRFEDGPPYEKAAAVFRLSRHANLYLKVTSHTIAWSSQGKATPETVFPKLVAEFGANRLAWGSNYPSNQGGLPHLLETAKRTVACLSPQDQEWLFGRTALILYPALNK